MRTLFIMLSAVLISQYGIAQGPPGGGRGGRGGRGGGRGQQAAPTPPPPPDPGFECIAHADTPDFPQAALQAHVDGTVYVWAKLTPQGTLDKIDTQVASAWADGSKLLAPPVEKVIRAATFKPECAGKTVAVVYRYELVGNPEPNPKPTTRTELNIVFIDSPPAAKPGAR